MATAKSPEYTEIAQARLSRGNNSDVAVLPKRRVVAAAGTLTNPDALNLLVAGNVTKMVGVTANDIAVAATGDLYDDGVVPVESDGSAIINPGDMLTANTTAGSVQGCVLKAIPGAGVNAHIIGQATTYAPATANTVIMMRIVRSVMQG